MTIIEINNGIFVNLENVYKIEISRKDNSESCCLKFYPSSDSYAESKEFNSVAEVRDWLSLRVIRATGSNEILDINA